jgi:hypothetical protein
VELGVEGVPGLIGERSDEVVEIELFVYPTEVDRVGSAFPVVRHR